MRGTTLTNLLVMLKAEVGDYSGTNPNRDAEYAQLLSNKQLWLASEYQWPFLERRWDAPVAANTQYVTLPTATVANPTETAAINLDLAPKVEVLFNQVYLEVSYGIGSEEYNFLNYAFAKQSDPIRRWRLATNPNEVTNANQFEVWPVPVTAQTIRFTGQRVLQALSAGSDTADLDDLLLVLFCASEKLARSKNPDAQQKATLAQRRLQMLRQNYGVRAEVRTMDGQGDVSWRRERHLTGMTILVR